MSEHAVRRMLAGLGAYTIEWWNRAVHCSQISCAERFNALEQGEQTRVADALSQLEDESAIVIFLTMLLSS